MLMTSAWELLSSFRAYSTGALLCCPGTQGDNFTETENALNEDKEMIATFYSQTHPKQLFFHLHNAKAYQTLNILQKSQQIKHMATHLVIILVYPP